MMVTILMYSLFSGLTYFATDLSKLVCEFEDANLFICNQKISNLRPRPMRHRLRRPA